MSLPASLPGERSLAGQQVALVGRLSLLTRRDTRSIVERLGGTFSTELTPRTTVVVLGADGRDLPSHVRRVLSEAELCREAGLPDLETLRAHYYSARDLRGMYPVIREEHLRYLEKLGLIHSVAGRYSFTHLHVVKHAASELEGGASIGSVLRDLASADRGQLAFDFQPPHS